MSKQHEAAKPAAQHAPHAHHAPVEKPVDVAALHARIADLEARLAVYEPPAAAPVPYPKWIYVRDAHGQIVHQALVADAAADAAQRTDWGS